jgi:hypothetical protein
VDFLNSDTVQYLIGHYGYGAIFVIVMLESAGIPMPGETILVTAAVYAAAKHALDIRWVIAAAAGGAILGDNIGFWVGREFEVDLGEPPVRHVLDLGRQDPRTVAREGGGGGKIDRPAGAGDEHTHLAPENWEPEYFRGRIPRMQVHGAAS